MLHESPGLMTWSRHHDQLLIVGVLSLATMAGLYFAYLDQGEFLHDRLSREDFLWPQIAEGFAKVLAGTTLEKLCGEAAQAAVRRSTDAYTYQI